MSAVSLRRARAAAAPGRVARGATARVRSAPLALVVLLVLAFVHATAWAVVTAPWQGPDEVAHFAYAEHLARTGHAPQRNSGTGGQSTAQNLALFQLNLFPIRLQPGGRPTYSALQRTKSDLSELPAKAYKDGSGPNSAANYPPVYYSYSAVAYIVSPFRGELGRLFTMRMFSVLLMVITVGLAWLIAAELLSRRWAVAVATGLVALEPKLGFAGGIVNPDIMLAMWASGALLAALRLVRRGPSAGRIAGLVACTALAVLTHPRGYFLPPFAVLALLVTLAVHRPRLRASALAGAAALVAMVVAVIAAQAWTTAHTGGGGSGNPNVAAGFNPRQFASYLWQFYLPKLASMDPKVGPPGFGYRQMFIESWYGSFGSFSVDFRPIFYDAMQVLSALGLAALFATIVARWREVVANWHVVVLCVAFFAGLMLLLHLVSYSTLLGTNDPVITGRYLLPAVSLYGAAAAWVCSSLGRRVGLPVAGVVLGIAVLVAVGGIGLSVERFYV